MIYQIHCLCGDVHGEFLSHFDARKFAIEERKIMVLLDSFIDLNLHTFEIYRSHRRDISIPPAREPEMFSIPKKPATIVFY